MLSTIVQSQSALVNIGFENGTFAGWSGATGICCPINATNPGIDSTRHVITSGNDLDTNSLGLIQVTAPGSNYSAKLGNENNDAESEVLEYSFQVPDDSMLLIIRFATLLENGLHIPAKQPRFGYEVTSNNGTLQGCFAEEVVAGSNYPGIIINGTIEIIPWQTRVIDLTGRLGDTIKIYFETGDCGPGGHFGYAYVDCELVSSVIEVEACHPDGSITLVASQGVNGQWHNGSTSDTLIIAEPEANGLYFLEVNQDFGCSFRLIVPAQSFFPEASFSTDMGCDGEVFFINNSVFEVGSVLNWNFGDGNSSSTNQPTHQFIVGSIYTTTLEITQPNNCKSEHSEIISILPSPQVEIDSDGSCVGIAVIFESNFISGQASDYTFTWYINNIQIPGDANCVHVFTQQGMHQIKLIIEDANNCTDTIESIVYISDLDECTEDELSPYLPNAFTPNGDGINDVFEIANVGAFTDVKLVVFNRYGEIISEGNFWNGSHNKIPSPQGAYGYKINYTHKNKRMTKVGVVMLVR